jgi:K+-transporting ATPase A subunit
MGNTSTKNIGDFQQNVGKSSTNINVIISMIIAIILVITGIIIGIRAIVPYADKPSSDKKCGDDINCFENETCDLKTRKCIKIKKTHYKLLIISFILFIIAFFIVWFSKFWKKEVYENKTLAEIQGTETEANIINNLFSNKN